MDAQKKLETFKLILSFGFICGEMDELDFLIKLRNLCFN